MLRNIKNIFLIKQKTIEKEISFKSKTEEVLAIFVKEEIIKNTNIDYQLSFSLNKGVIKIETDNKVIAQEIALRIRNIEGKLRSSGVDFKKILI